MRRIRQPGPETGERASTVAVKALPIAATLPAGARFLDALHHVLAETRCESACLSLQGGGFSPFAYVIPALAPDASHAAFYSATFRPMGLSSIVAGSVTVGWRDGAPFFHCHALWHEADGDLRGGHVLPEETLIAEPITVSGVGIVGARFEAHQDAETGFKLFMPIATGTPLPAVGRPALAVRLKPNQDITLALEKLGHQAGFALARLHGGVGSIIGADYADAPAVSAFATEIFVTDARIDCRATDAPPADSIAIGLADLTGAVSQGRLIRGSNPILMTLEGVLESLPEI